jgi:hypothetical protein
MATLQAPLIHQIPARDRFFLLLRRSQNGLVILSKRINWRSLVFTLPPKTLDFLTITLGLILVSADLLILAITLVFLAL